MTKVKLPKEVADALEMYLREFDNITLIKMALDKDRYGWAARYSAFHSVGTDTLLTALVNGYEVEQTPEEKVREYYETEREYFHEWLDINHEINATIIDAKLTAIRQTLSILGITIEGVND